MRGSHTRYIHVKPVKHYYTHALLLLLTPDSGRGAYIQRPYRGDIHVVVEAARADTPWRGVADQTNFQEKGMRGCWGRYDCALPSSQRVEWLRSGYKTPRLTFGVPCPVGSSSSGRSNCCTLVGLRPRRPHNDAPAVCHLPAMRVQRGAAADVCLVHASPLLPNA